MKIIISIILLNLILTANEKVCGMKIDFNKITTKYKIGKPQITKTFENKSKMKNEKYLLYHLGECKD